MRGPGNTKLTVSRRNALAASALLTALATLGGCGSQASPRARGSSTATASVPSYVTEPFTHQQQLVEQGAHLVVADGCSACHLPGAKAVLGPSFLSFAGHRVELSDGRHVVVDERFLHQALRDPRFPQLAGYDPEPMLRTLRRLHLSAKPQQVAALAAFIEQVGPETE
jgi:hypothetical protein